MKKYYTPSGGGGYRHIATGKVYPPGAGKFQGVTALIKKRRVGESGVSNGTAMLAQKFIVTAAELSATWR